MQFRNLLAAGLMAVCLSAATAPKHPAYAEGQVWEYRALPGDEESLLRIQKIEVLPDAAEQGPVYHISIIGLHMAGLAASQQLQHAPVSRESLDASVTRLSSAHPAFPDPGPSIAEWRAAHGDVFTVPVAEVVRFVKQALAAPDGDKVAAATPIAAAARRAAG